MKCWFHSQPAASTRFICCETQSNCKYSSVGSTKKNLTHKKYTHSPVTLSGTHGWVKGSGSVMVWGTCSRHTLASPVPAEHPLDAAASLSVAADRVPPFTATVEHLLVATSSRRHTLQRSKLQSSQTRSVHWSPQSADLSPTEQGRGGTGAKSAATV